MSPVAVSFVRCLFAVIAVFLVMPGFSSAAGATSGGSIAYISDNDVWIANPDGSHHFRVTWDGTANSPYRSPSQADNGIIAAGHLNDIVLMRQSGDLIREIDPPALTNSVSHPMDGAPVDVAISPNGRIIAWSFVGYECDSTVDCGPRTATGYTDASGRTPVSRDGSTFFHNPSWVGNSRTIQTGGYGSQVMLHDPGHEPVHWFDDSDYAEQSTDLSDSELSADGQRLAAVRGYGEDSRIITFGVSGNAKSGPAPTVPTPDCITDTEEGIAAPTWAPDSDHLAWEESDGIWAGDLGNCGNAGQKLVIPGGTEPDWGPARVDPSPGGVKLPYPSLKRALKKGLTIDFTSIGKGRVDFKVKFRGAVIAADHGRAPSAGPLQAVVNIRKSARRRLTGRKKVKLKISVTQAGRSAVATGFLKR